MALANDPLIGTFADRARALTLAHAAREAEGDPLTLTQVRAVLLGTAPPPMTQDQMFTLLTHRLDDLEDVLLSDTSPRETWAQVTIEREMRRNIICPSWSAWPQAFTASIKRPCPQTKRDRHPPAVERLHRSRA